MLHVTAAGPMKESSSIVSHQGMREKAARVDAVGAAVEAASLALAEPQQVAEAVAKLAVVTVCSSKRVTMQLNLKQLQRLLLSEQHSWLWHQLLVPRSPLGCGLL